MNQQMWANAATHDNLTRLTQHGIHVLGPDSGAQACGEVGPGRMLEPNAIVDGLASLFATGALDGLTVMVTAGPTWEAIDPVRGLTNHSSGKMGYAVASAAAEAGARVLLIAGPTTLPDPERVETIHVVSAQEMYDAVHAYLRPCDIFIGVAAVADYRPTQVAKEKIKKSTPRLTLELERTPDILASVAAFTPRPFTVGFAAETENLEANARAKLAAKKLDLVAANPVGQPGLGFNAEDNALLLVDAAGSTTLPAQPKSKLARALIQLIAERYHARQQHPAQHRA
jgi:phosphopantothenoylcysteine decarboxylase/phosphopantothenate--cysteine ligase